MDSKIKIRIEIEADNISSLKDFINKMINNNNSETVTAEVNLPEQVVVAVANENNNVNNNEDKLKKFLNYLSPKSKSFIELLMRRNTPVLVAEIIQETPIKDQSGIGGALRGVTSAAKKVGMPNPVRKVSTGDGNASFEFVNWS